VVPNRLNICFVFLLSLFATGCGEFASTVADTDRRSPTTDYRSPTTDHSASLLTPSSKTINLGIVRQAGREQETFELENPGTEPVEVVTFSTSCECLEIDLSRRLIGPGEKVLAQTTLDLGKEPQFLGNLGIEAKGLASDGQTAFSIVVEVSARPPAEFDGPSGTDN
jgi:hypothetical protein